MPGTPETRPITGRAPDYWLRRRAGDDPDDAMHISAADAEMIAQRPDAIGDLYSRGLVWQEPDASSYSGTTFVTLTPVWEQQ